MIVEINDTLINLDNVCVAEKYDNANQLHIVFTGGWQRLIGFDNPQNLETAYQTIKLFETVIKSK